MVKVIPGETICQLSAAAAAARNVSIGWIEFEQHGRLSQYDTVGSGNPMTGAASLPVLQAGHHIPDGRMTDMSADPMTGAR
jgi:hypothetical protein